MFKKIGVRNELLLRFKYVLNQANPYKLDDVAKFIYYDSVNKYLPKIKKYKVDNQAAAIYILRHGLEDFLNIQRNISTDLPLSLQDTVEKLHQCHIEETFRLLDLPWQMESPDM